MILMADQTSCPKPTIPAMPSPQGAPSKSATSKSNGELPMVIKMENVLDIDVSPQGIKLRSEGFGRATPVQPNTYMTPSPSHSGIRPLSPRRSIDKGRVQHPELPYHPTTGQLHPKVTIKRESAKKLDFTPTPRTSQISPTRLSCIWRGRQH